MVKQSYGDRQATPGEYFRAAWAVSNDPWDHAGRWYEARKYDLTVASLPAHRYQRAFEPGCGVGLLTCRLASRAASVIAADREPEAVAATRERCADLANVEVAQLEIPTAWPEGRFDLVVLSEVLYYLDRPSLLRTLDRTWTCTKPGGDLVLVHYRRLVADHTWTGGEVHEIAADCFACSPLVTHVEDDFRLDVYRR